MSFSIQPARTVVRMRPAAAERKCVLAASAAASRQNRPPAAGPISADNLAQRKQYGTTRTVEVERFVAILSATPPPPPPLPHPAREKKHNPTVMQKYPTTRLGINFCDATFTDTIEGKLTLPLHFFFFLRTHNKRREVQLSRCLC